MSENEPKIDVLFPGQLDGAGISGRLDLKHCGDASEKPYGQWSVTPILPCRILRFHWPDPPAATVRSLKIAGEEQMVSKRLPAEWLFGKISGLDELLPICLPGQDITVTIEQGDAMKEEEAELAIQLARLMVWARSQGIDAIGFCRALKPLLTLEQRQNLARE